MPIIRESAPSSRRRWPSTIIPQKLGVPVEIVSADHLQKPDVGVSIARRWYDNEGVDVIMDVPNSAVALAVDAVTTEKNKTLIGSGAGSDVMTGAQCSPNFVHWTYDTWSLGHSPRPRPRRGRRQDLVLHHRRLRLRQEPREERGGCGRSGGRQGARRGASPDQHRGFLVLPPAGAGVGRGRDRYRQCRRRHQQHAETGRRIRARQEAAHGRAHSQRHQHPEPRAHGGAERQDRDPLSTGIATTIFVPSPSASARSIRATTCRTTCRPACIRRRST